MSKYTSRPEFEKHLANNNLTPVLLEAIIKQEGAPDHYSFIDNLIKKKILDMELILNLLDRWEWKDSYLETGVPNEEMSLNHQIPVRLVYIRGEREKTATLREDGPS